MDRKNIDDLKQIAKDSQELIEEYENLDPKAKEDDNPRISRLKKRLDYFFNNLRPFEDEYD